MVHYFTPYKYPIKLPNDDSRIIKNTKLINIIKLEKKPKKYNSFNIKRKISIEYFSEEMIEEDSKNESNDKDSIDDTDHSSKSQKNNDDLKKPKKRNTSHSSNSLLNIGEIEGPIEEIQRNNISDDESEKINMEINKSNKKFFENFKKNNIDFSNNMKNIFNNIGNISPFKNEKISEENKEENDFLLKCYIKSENILKVYYSKLLLNRIWKPLNDSQRHNYLIIFDWDDTLLPTSFLIYKNVIGNENKLNEKDQIKISKLEELPSLT